jgi:hypothetical protein
MRFTLWISLRLMMLLPSVADLDRGVRYVTPFA